MIALVRSELRRFASRRIVKALVLLALADIAVIGTVLAIQSSPPGAAELAAAERQAAVDRAACVDQNAFGSVIPEGQTVQEVCRELVRPGQYVTSNVFDIANLPTVLEGTSFLFAIGGWLVGASFVGAEWQAGSMATLLTWEPRRVRVLLAKAVACAVGIGVVTVGLEAVFGGVLALVAATRGSTAAAGDAFWSSTAELVLRISAVTAIGGLLGLALAMVSRNTGAAIGIAFAYLAVVESLIRALKPAWQPWLIGDNANVLVLGRDQGFPPIGRSVWGAAFVLLGYVAAFLFVAGASLRARDVN